MREAEAATYIERNGTEGMEEKRIRKIMKMVNCADEQMTITVCLHSITWIKFVFALVISSSQFFICSDIFIRFAHNMYIHAVYTTIMIDVADAIS